MEARLIPHSRIRNALRKLWLFSPQRRDCKKASRIAPGIYQCQGCGQGHKVVEIDHSAPVGATPGSRLSGPEDTWDSFIKKLFVPSNELRVLCRACHLKRRQKES